MTLPTNGHPAITKRVGEYDPTTGAYPGSSSIDDEGEQLIGIRWTAGDADRLCDEYAFDYFADRHTPEKAAEIAARVNWSESPSARLIPCEELRQLYQTDPAAYRARLAALDEATLNQQAAVYASYHTVVTNKPVTTEETLTRFRRSIAIHNARAAITFSEDAISNVLFELALTDQPALIEFLRGHTAHQRDQLAWRFAAWLRRHHGIVREPAFIARGWASLIVGASASGVDRDTARPEAQQCAESGA